MSRYNDDFTNDDLVGDICRDDDSDILFCLADVWDVSELEYEPVTAEDIWGVMIDEDQKRVAYSNGDVSITWDYRTNKARYLHSEARRRGFVSPKLAKRMHKHKVTA